MLLAERVDRRVEREHDERDPDPEARPAASPAPGGPAARERPACGAGRGAPTSDRRDDLERLERPRREKRRRVHVTWKTRAPCTSSTTTSSHRELRDVEARYVGKLGFELVARYGRIGDEHVADRAGRLVGEARPATGSSSGCRSSSAAPSTSSSSRATGASRASTTSASRSTRTSSRRCSARATQWNLRVQEHGGRRTFVATNAGYRLEVHPPREWIDELLDEQGRAAASPSCSCAPTSPRRRRARSPTSSASRRTDNAVEVGGTVVRFVAGRPGGRPELYGERFA